MCVGVYVYIYMTKYTQANTNIHTGCGFGDNAIYLASKGYKVLGFDFSQKAVDVAIYRSKQNNVSHLCEFVQADALNVPTSCLNGKKFDTILDSACLQCFDPNTQVP